MADHQGTMRSIRLEKQGSVEHLKMVKEDVPSVQRGEVLVKVKASSLNYRDLAMLNNQYPGEVHDNLIPLSDGAGEIVAVGEGVRRFRIGDRVAGNFTREWFGGKRPTYMEPYGSHSDGWLTEYKVLNPELLVSIPSHLSYEEAATLPCAAVTAWSALHGPSPLSAGDTVLTLGSGGVSVFALQLAKVMGVNVISTTSSDEKAEKLKKLGADEVINYSKTPNWGEVAKELTGGRGVNRVVEVVGPATFQQSLQAIAPGDEISLIGVLSRTGDKIDYFDLFGKASTRTIGVGSRNDFESMNRVMEDKGLMPIVDSVFPFEKAAEAYEYLESQKFFGKIAITHE
ncbi:NADPH:quinone reductase-like Zn-dependent oxidoreductase [Salibacterium salarium]|uniref:zinc-dependent alcohol dehydrogenase family protein n=1 Tax=Salibacterium salarium TaxID=284579 RepID=UPI0027852E09|nr:NAD(P)-dependent alcohol dehydrogenase [Salibacterium salarium]MDQ0300350.1 NADPH:quinone reductase-like Zn-dependent oxidoreductase [Salibacterium salarium]